MSYSLADLQMLAESVSTVEETRHDLNEVVAFFRSKDESKVAVKVIAERVRYISLELLNKQKCFFIPEDFTIEDLPEAWRVEALGLVRNNHIVMSGRFVYPVFDTKRNVMGFCGWDPYVNPKYLDSKNHGYKANNNTLYGMEDLEEYYKSDKPVYFVEGIVCRLFLCSKGLHAMALLGSNLTPYVIQIIRRFGKRACIIPDNDVIGKELDKIDNPAGEHLVYKAKKYLPHAVVCQSKIAKDIDDSRLLDDSAQADMLIVELKQIMVNPLLPLNLLRVR